MTDSPSDERTGRSSTPKDPFFQPVTSRSASRDPNYQKNDQRDAILAQVRGAQLSTEAGQLDAALRASRSQSRQRGEGSASRSSSHIRNMIKSIANDPFFHRTTKEEAAQQSAHLHQIILDEVAAAQAAQRAGSQDREARSRSRSRLGDDSQPASRGNSRVRSAVNSLLGREDTRHEADIKEEPATTA